MWAYSLPSKMQAFSWIKLKKKIKIFIDCNHWFKSFCYCYECSYSTHIKFWNLNREKCGLYQHTPQERWLAFFLYLILNLCDCCHQTLKFRMEKMKELGRIKCTNLWKHIRFSIGHHTKLHWKHQSALRMHQQPNNQGKYYHLLFLCRSRMQNNKNKRKGNLLYSKLNSLKIWPKYIKHFPVVAKSIFIDCFCQLKMNQIPLLDLWILIRVSKSIQLI